MWQRTKYISRLSGKDAEVQVRHLLANSSSQVYSDVDSFMKNAIFLDIDGMMEPAIMTIFSE